MDERTQKAFDFAQESVKQLLGMATGLIALTITFSKDFLATVPLEMRWLAGASWIAYLISAVGGLWTLLALTGNLGAAASSTVSVTTSNVTIPAKVQILFFLVALVLTVTFGWTALL